MAAGASLELRVPRRRQGGLEGWQAVGEPAKETRGANSEFHGSFLGLGPRLEASRPGL